MTDAAPLVTVVCLSHNHARFVAETLRSVAAQTYPHVELIVVDDGSRDGSPAVIEAALRTMPYAHFLRWPEPVGNCRAFNRALAGARGKYVIDLAADDLLLPDRVAQQVALFETLDDDWAVVYSDAYFVDVRSRVVGAHTPRPAPTGDVYRALLGSFFLLSPTVIYRRALLEQLGGYDETLAYEDFDVLMRLARDYRFAHLPAVTTLKRRVPGSLSTRFYARRRNALQRSTLRVCRKVHKMNRTPDEHAALARTVRYHLRQAFWTENHALVPEYAELLRHLDALDAFSARLLQAARLKPPVGRAYDWYRALRAHRRDLIWRLGAGG
ncbi:MAG: glycosyltransferase, partial [Catalinimonas sp.]